MPDRQTVSGRWRWRCGGENLLRQSGAAFEPDDRIHTLELEASVRLGYLYRWAWAWAWLGASGPYDLSMKRLHNLRAASVSSRDWISASY